MAYSGSIVKHFSRHIEMSPADRCYTTPAEYCIIGTATIKWNVYAKYQNYDNRQIFDLYFYERPAPHRHQYESLPVLSSSDSLMSDIFLFNVLPRDLLLTLCRLPIKIHGNVKKFICAKMSGKLFLKMRVCDNTIYILAISMILI